MSSAAPSGGAYDGGDAKSPAGQQPERHVTFGRSCCYRSKPQAIPAPPVRCGKGGQPDTRSKRADIPVARLAPRGVVITARAEKKMYPKYHIRGNYHRNAPTLLASFGGNAVAVSSFERAPLCVLEAKQDAEAGKAHVLRPLLSGKLG